MRRVVIESLTPLESGELYESFKLTTNSGEKKVFEIAFEADACSNKIFRLCDTVTAKVTAQEFVRVVEEYADSLDSFNNLLHVHVSEQQLENVLSRALEYAEAASKLRGLLASEEEKLDAKLSELEVHKYIMGSSFSSLSIMYNAFSSPQENVINELYNRASDFSWVCTSFVNKKKVIDTIRKEMSDINERISDLRF